MLRIYHNLFELAGVFDYFVIDVWGVLHDGQTPYPGAIQGLRELKRREKRVLLLSNTPSTTAALIKELAAFGFALNTYDAVLTSGQVTREMIQKREDRGQSYYYLGPQERSGLLAGLGYQPEATLEEAHFLLVTGLDDARPHPADYRELLQKAGQLRLPMYCANPDLAFSRQDGSIIPCAGRLAQEYEGLGGKVHYYGKPSSVIYQEALARLGCSIPAQAAAVGDSLATDVKGAKEAGLYAVLLAGGLVVEQAGSHQPEAINDYSYRCGLRPDAILQSFTWPSDGATEK